MFYVVGIDEDEPVGEALRVVWGELCQVRDGSQHVALAVDDDEGPLARPELVEVPELEVLEELGLPVARAPDNVRMLKPRPEGDGEGERRLQELDEGRPPQIRLQHLGRCGIFRIRWKDRQLSGWPGRIDA